MFDDDIEDIDDDDDDADEGREHRRFTNHETLVHNSRKMLDDLEDFITDDTSSENEEGNNTRYDKRLKSATRHSTSATTNHFDDDKLAELYDIFGDGKEYAWALDVEGDHDAEDEDGQSDNETPKLHDIFEQSELKERMLTDEDNTIRVLDVPERYQKLRESFKSGYKSNDTNFQEEQEWVSTSFVQEKFLEEDPLEVPTAEAVKNILVFLVKEQLEVPFIWYHRRDYMLYVEEGKTATLILDNNDLWRILQLDVEYRAIHEQRQIVEKLYETIDKDDPIYEDIYRMADSIISYQDLFDYLQFQYSSTLRINNEGSTRRHHKYGLYDRIRNDRMYDLVRGIGIAAREVGENIISTDRVFQTIDTDEYPEDIVNRLLEDPQGMFHNKAQYTSAAKEMFAQELNHDPRIRRAVRNYYSLYCMFSVAVTEKGKLKIDDKSPYYDFKYAINLSKQLLNGHPDRYLRMLEAESKGYIFLKVFLPEYEDFIEQLKTNILSENDGAYATAWNEFRLETLNATLQKLQPLMERSIKEELRKECERYLFSLVRDSVGVMLRQAPFKPPAYVPGTVPRVLTISFGFGNPYKDAVFGFYLDENGTNSEHVKFESEPKLAEFRLEFVNLVKRRKPDVIGICGYTIESDGLRAILDEIIKEEELSTVNEDENPILIPLVWVRDDVARLYQNSKRALAEFPDQPQVGRYCVGLARYLQSPLLEYLNLGKDVRSIQFDPHQRLLTEERLQEAIDSSFVDVVNTVGVDINQAVNEQYYAAALPYVCGLGPRKASGVLQAIQARGSRLLNRTELITGQITTKTIFMNCASFLKIPYEENTFRNEEIELLDATRIHPEDYDLARKMAGDALDLDEEDLLDLETTGGVISQIIGNDETYKLNDLELESYDRELSKLDSSLRKRFNLELIKQELQNNYGELRDDMIQLSTDDVFTILTGETKDTLREGMIVPVLIKRIFSSFLIVKLPCMIEGVVQRQYITDREDVPHPSVLFHPNQTVSAKLIKLDKENFKAELSTRENEVSDARENAKKKQFFCKSETWDFEQEQLDRQQESRKKQAEARASRVVKHRLFRNMDSKEAERFLEPYQRGDVIIRPSSRGIDHLVVTWKVGKNVYQHLDIKEKDKPNEYSLGRKLEIEDQTYADLDELILYHIKSKAKKIDELIHSEKCYKDVDTLDKIILQLSNSNPNRAYYGFALNPTNPGYFFLHVKPPKSNNIIGWHVKVVIDGYMMRGHFYTDPMSLCNGLKTLMMSEAENKRNLPKKGHHRRF